MNRSRALLAADSRTVRFGRFGKTGKWKGTQHLTRPLQGHYIALMLLGALRQNKKLSDWAKWVRDNPKSAARETRDFLERCLANIPKNKQGTFLHRIRSADVNVADSLLHELVAHELLRRLGLEPQFGPKLDDRLTPDMMVKIANQQFIVDVFLTRNPSRTIQPLCRIFPGTAKELQDLGVYTVDSGDRAKKIRDSLLEKYRKYAQTGAPLILIVFLGDHHMQMPDVETALYGEPLTSTWLSEGFPNSITKFRRELVDRTADNPPGGTMLPDEAGQCGCPKLSAVLACDWFDTLDRGHPGKRMRCLILHHWKPDVPIPAGMFGGFAEVTWTLGSSGTYRHNLTKSLNTVAKFRGTNGLVFRKYTASEPW